MKLLLELSYYDLKGRTDNIFGKERTEKSNGIQLDKIEYIPMMQNRSLKVTANTHSKLGSNYKTSVFLDNLNYLNQEENNSFNFEGNDGNEYHIEKLNPADNIRVNCSCLDFHYRFAVWDDKFKALDGDPPKPYVRKTNTRPEVNPMKSPGLCKHLLALIDYLKNDGLFR